MLRALIVPVALWAGASLAQEVPTPAPPELAAGSYYLVDFASETVIAGHEPDTPRPPASLTKLMTGYVVFKALAQGLVNLDDKAHVSEKAWRTGGSRMFIEVDTEVSVEDLLRGMIIQSGNDAAIALAERVAGSEEAFVERMNDFAQALGMRNTSFRNPTGLPARGHYSTARDLALLAHAIIDEFPQYYGWYSERDFTYNDIWQPNRNKLLRSDPSVDGLKTGYTRAAGYCQVSSAVRDGMRLIAVVLGMESSKARTRSSQALLDYGFRFFETEKLFTRGQTVSAIRVWKGESEHVGLTVPKDIYVTAPRNQFASLIAKAEIPEIIYAPLRADEPIGALSVELYEKKLLTIPLIVLKEVPQAGFWGRITDELELWME